MAEVPININGVICDLYGRTIMGPIKIVGSMSRTDRQIGGGPITPPELPTEPPTEPPTSPSEDGTITKAPPSGGGWGYSPEYGWGYFPGPGEPEPKK